MVTLSSNPLVLCLHGSNLYLASMNLLYGSNEVRQENISDQRFRSFRDSFSPGQHDSSHS